MTIDDVAGDFMSEYAYEARNFLLSAAKFAGRLKDGAEGYDPRYSGAVGLALGAATLHDKTWDTDLGCMVLKLARYVDLFHNSHIFSDDVQNALRKRVYQLQSRIWEYVSPHSFQMNAEAAKVYRQEARDHLTALLHRVRRIGDPRLEFHIEEALYALEHPRDETPPAPDLTKLERPSSSAEADKSPEPAAKLEPKATASAKTG